MEEKWETRVKKLALAFETGWQYMPGSEEAGSVLTDLFLEMAGKNKERLERIWEKQELEFLQAAPVMGQEPEADCRGALLVTASGQEDGCWLEEGVLAWARGEQGETFRFRTACSLQLTAAGLRYAVYRRGLWAWLVPGEQEKQGGIALFQPVGALLEYPVFCWHFSGLWDGRREFCFRVEFGREAVPVEALCGDWTVSDGERCFPVTWRQSDSGCFLEGRTPEFAGNLSGRPYQVSLGFPDAGKPVGEWLELLCGEVFLAEGAREWEPEVCLAGFESCGPERVLPFGDAPEESACLYVSCDGIPRGSELGLLFRESFLEEERLPEPVPREYEKLYRKYPWLKTTGTVEEWRPEETRWEYFNGNLWRTLPGSECWNTGCGGEGGERDYVWQCPPDMRSCAVEGEEHLYLRLRLVRVSNAYAAFYRKRIPVLEGIRLAAGEYRETYCLREIPDPAVAGEEKMYLGFDREITPHNRWFAGEGYGSFREEQLKGWDKLFGRKAFWAELTEKKEEILPCLLPNYVQIRQEPEDKGRENGEEGEFRIEPGTKFTLEPLYMGLLEAVCPWEICRAAGGTAEIPEKTAAEHGFAHFGRLLTPLDLELMLQERFPLLRVHSCVFRKEERCLHIELSFQAEDGNRKLFRTLQEQQRELGLALPRVRQWLEETVVKKGPLWLKDCGVEVTFQEGRSEYARADIFGRQQL